MGCDDTKHTKTETHQFTGLLICWLRHGAADVPASCRAASTVRASSLPGAIRWAPVCFGAPALPRFCWMVRLMRILKTFKTLAKLNRAKLNLGTHSLYRRRLETWKAPYKGSRPSLEKQRGKTRRQAKRKLGKREGRRSKPTEARNERQKPHREARYRASASGHPRRGRGSSPCFGGGVSR